MNIRHQYLQNKSTGKIKTAGYLNLSANIPDGYDLIMGDLPDGAQFELSLMGKKLCNYLERELSNQLNDMEKSINLLTRLAPLKLFLDSAAANPLMEDQLNNLTDYLDLKRDIFQLTDDELARIKDLIDIYLNLSIDQ